MQLKTTMIITMMTTVMMYKLRRYCFNCILYSWLLKSIYKYDTVSVSYDLPEAVIEYEVNRCYRYIL